MFALTLVVGLAVAAQDPIRPNPYDVWQNYAVDRGGRWKPRVVVHDGMRFLADGRPYPWWQNYPGSFEPLVAFPATLPSATVGWARMPYCDE